MPRTTHPHKMAKLATVSLFFALCVVCVGATDLSLSEKQAELLLFVVVIFQAAWYAFMSFFMYCTVSSNKTHINTLADKANILLPTMIAAIGYARGYIGSANGDFAATMALSSASVANILVWAVADTRPAAFAVLGATSGIIISAISAIPASGNYGLTRVLAWAIIIPEVFVGALSIADILTGWLTAKEKLTQRCASFYKLYLNTLGANNDDSLPITLAQWTVSNGFGVFGNKSWSIASSVGIANIAGIVILAVAAAALKQDGTANTTFLGGPTGPTYTATERQIIIASIVSQVLTSSSMWAFVHHKLSRAPPCFTNKINMVNNYNMLLARVQQSTGMVFTNTKSFALAVNSATATQRNQLARFIVIMMWSITDSAVHKQVLFGHAATFEDMVHTINSLRVTVLQSDLLKRGSELASKATNLMILSNLFLNSLQTV